VALGRAAALRKERRRQTRARAGIGLGFHRVALLYLHGEKKRTVEIHCETRSDGP
jgi:hypothetical protein